MVKDRRPTVCHGERSCRGRDGSTPARGVHVSQMCARRVSSCIAAFWRRVGVALGFPPNSHPSSGPSTEAATADAFHFCAV